MTLLLIKPSLTWKWITSYIIIVFNIFVRTTTALFPLRISATQWQSYVLMALDSQYPAYEQTLEVHSLKLEDKNSGCLSCAIKYLQYSYTDFLHIKEQLYCLEFPYCINWAMTIKLVQSIRLQRTSGQGLLDPYTLKIVKLSNSG